MLQASSGDFATVEMNASERTLYNSSSKSLARKKVFIKTRSVFSKHFSSGWILLVPNLSLLKYFDMALARQKSSKIVDSGLSVMESTSRWNLQVGETEKGSSSKWNFWKRKWVKMINSLTSKTSQKQVFSWGGTSKSMILPQRYHTGRGHELAGMALDPAMSLCPSRRWGRGDWPGGS